MVRSSVANTKNDTIPFAKRYKGIHYEYCWIVCGIIRRCCYGK